MNFEDEQFQEDFDNPSHPNYPYLEKTLLCLALCHTIIVDKKEDGKIVYNSSSPDELALVNAARVSSIPFIDYRN